MATDVKLSSEFTIIYGGEVIAYATDFTLERNKEVVDITKLGDTWKNKKTVLKDFSVSFNAMITRGDTITSSLWDPTTAYSAGDYVVLAGNAYEAQGSTTGDNPTTDSGSNWLETSDYASGTTYAAGDMVYYQTVDNEKRIYISLVGSNIGNNPPDSATQWERLETNYESLLNELKYNDTAVKCTIKPTSTSEIYYYGDGVITSLSSSIGVSDKVTFSGTFEGSAALTTVTGDYPSVLDDGNTIAWFDANVSYITKDGSDLVSQWSDRSGNANHLLQATPSDQPLWSANGVLFYGVTEYMKCAAFTIAQPTFLYIVFKQITWTRNDVIFDGESASRGKLYQFNTPTPAISASGGITGTQSIDLVLDTWGIVRVLFNGVSSKMIVDDNTPIVEDFGALSMNGFTLGCQGNIAVFSNIEVKETIIRAVVDGPTDEAAIYDYLKNRYSL